MNQFMDSLDLQTPVKYKGMKGMIAARCYSVAKKRNEYDLMLFDRKGKRNIVKYVTDKEFKVLPQEQPKIAPVP